MPGTHAQCLCSGVDAKRFDRRSAAGASARCHCDRGEARPRTVPPAADCCAALAAAAVYRRTARLLMVQAPPGIASAKRVSRARQSGRCLTRCVIQRRRPFRTEDTGTAWRLFRSGPPTRPRRYNGLPPPKRLALRGVLDRGILGHPPPRLYGGLPKRPAITLICSALLANPKGLILSQ